jgi:hypothetical protein
MNAITFHVPESVQEKIREIADSQGTSVDSLLGEFTIHMIREYEARQLFLQMKERGQTEVEAALELLRR